MIVITANGVNLDLQSDLRIMISMDNPLLESDRIPAAYSTTIEFPATINNMSVFNIFNKMYVKPSSIKIEASMSYSNIPILDGILCVTEITNRYISATFIGASIGDDLKSEFESVKMDSWEYDSLEAAGSSFLTLLRSAVAGNENFGIAPILRTDAVSDPDTSISERFINYQSMFFYLGYIKRQWMDSFFSPAIRFTYILESIFKGKIDFSSIDIDQYKDLLLITGFRKNADPYKHWGGLEPLDDKEQRFLFSLQNSLPDVKTNEFIIEFAKLFGITFFPNGSVFQAKYNNDIISANTVDDWSGKITDTYNISTSAKQVYQYGYSANETQSESTSEPIIVSDIQKMVDYPYKEDINEYCDVFRIEGTGDIYSREYMGESMGVKYYDFKLIKNGSMYNKEASDEVFDAVSNFSPVPPVIDRQGAIIYDSSYRPPRPIGYDAIYRQIPTVSISANENSKPRTMYIGIFHGVKNAACSSSNIYQYPMISTNGYDMKGNKISNLTLSWNSDNGLYNRYHKIFAEWIEKDKALLRTEAILSANDLRNIDLSKKYAVKGKVFFIKSLSIELSHFGIEPADVEFIEA